MSSMANNSTTNNIVVLGALCRDRLKARLENNADSLGIPNWREIGWYMNPGFTTRYGVELEFCSTKNRYNIANATNTCMFEQHNPYWRNNFNILRPTPEERNQFRNGISGPRSITDGPDMNQWSSSMFEVSQDHGSDSYQGTKTPENKGIAGSKIEEDSSVEFSPNKGIAYAYTKDSETTIHRLISTYSSICDRVHSFNEFVTPVLTNEPVLYPYVYVKENTFTKSYIPYGFIALDNAIDHMISHNNTILIQNMGLHVHLSEFPRITDKRVRKECLIGFFKLFFLFEPLLFACQPNYRHQSHYCQSVQTIFNYDELLNNDADTLYNLLTIKNYTTSKRLNINNRLARWELRYIALNMTNCETTGTVEVRLGHSTFDSSYLNHYIHMLQSLFELSIALCSTDGQTHVNNILIYAKNKKLLPKYVFNERQRGIYPAFFSNSHTTENERTYIVTQLLIHTCLFTGAAIFILKMIPFILDYHGTDTHQHFWLRYNKLDLKKWHQYTPQQIFVSLLNEMKANYGMEELPIWNRNILSSASYAKSQKSDGTYVTTNVNEACDNCFKKDGSCGTGFNQYNNTNNTNNVNAVTAFEKYMDEQNENITNYTMNRPTTIIPPKSLTQCELLSSKIQMGGKRRTCKRGTYKRGTYKRRTCKRGTYKRKGKSVKRNTYRGGKAVQNLMTPLPNVMEMPVKQMNKVNTSNRSKMSSKNVYEMLYQVNKGAAKIVVDKKFNAFEVDWLGNRKPLDDLSVILQEIVQKGILTPIQMHTLVRHLYVDHYVYLDETPLHQRKLVEELARFNINEPTIEAMRSVYKKYNS